MAEATKDPRAVELGRRGGLARRSRQTPEERKAIARLGGIARAAKAPTRREHEALLPTNVTELVSVSYEITPWEAMRGAKVGDDPQAYIDRCWTPRLIRFFEQTMQSYTRAGNLDGAFGDGGNYFDSEPRPVAPPSREVHLRDRSRPFAFDRRADPGHA